MKLNLLISFYKIISYYYYNTIKYINKNKYFILFTKKISGNNNILLFTFKNFKRKNYITIQKKIYLSNIFQFKSKYNFFNKIKYKFFKINYYSAVKQNKMQIISIYFNMFIQIINNLYYFYIYIPCYYIRLINILFNIKHKKISNNLCLVLLLKINNINLLSLNNFNLKYIYIKNKYIWLSNFNIKLITWNNLFNGLLTKYKNNKLFKFSLFINYWYINKLYLIIKNKIKLIYKYLIFKIYIIKQIKLMQRISKNLPK